MIKNIIFLISIYFLISVNASAYIDPGSGSILLQALIGSLAAAGATVAIYWEKLKSFFSKKIRKKEDDEK